MLLEGSMEVAQKNDLELFGFVMIYKFGLIYYDILCEGLELGRRISCFTVEWQTADWVTACEG